LKRRALAGVALQLLTVAAVLALVAFIAVPPLGTYGTLVVLVLAALCFWHSIQTLMKYANGKPRVVPYFELKYFRSLDSSRKTAEESHSAFLGGNGIAANLPQLDTFAQQIGVAPLSNFGFGDDLLNQQPQWSDMTDGLRTLRALIAKAGEPLEARRLSAMTITDLQTLAAALEKALEGQRRFCLILRYGPDAFISGVEMEK
jgi:hypothetical protein